MTDEANERTVLFIDDDRVILRIVKELLGQLGIERVHCIESGRAALDWLDAQSTVPNLLVCDLNMPDLDGIELLRQLRTRRYSGCIAITTGEDERILQTALQLVRAQGMRCAGSLRKPIVREAISRLIDEAARLDALRPRRTERKSYDVTALATAIRDGQIFNVYQPQVRPSDLSFVAVEALVRWAHPTDGTVFPDQFITLAEENGLIDDLAWAVIRSALDDLRRWRESGMPLRVAVNVSMENLRSVAFPDRLMSLAQELGVPIEGISLEITESRLMSDPVATLDILARLRLRHVRLSIDDFGTGHSSLAQLRDVPFDELKIDRGFIQAAWRSQTNRAIVEASLGMAQRLSVETVAEGVEDAQDWEFVRSAGCDLVQGYFVARPMLAGRIPEWLEEWRGRALELAVPA